MIGTKETQMLTRLSQILEKVREEDPQIPVPHVLALLVVASRPGVSQKELGHQLGLSKSASHRVFAKLSPEGVEGRPGLGWLIYRPGADAREREAFLTPKGDRLLASVRSIMEL
jgi:DNA-binding MarR family transcriptional regulator